MRNEKKHGAGSGGDSEAETIDSAFRNPHSAIERLPDTRRDVQANLSTQRSQSSKAFYQTVARWGVQAAEALAYAHENAVLHRDIKPGNLLLDANGNVWITDFGLARLEKDASMTMTGDLLGTLRYMAPEQTLAKRIPIDHRADIYSLGATLYELLTLRPVIAGNDRTDLLRQLAFAEPKPPRKIDPKIPAELETIVLKAVAKSPDERYATAQDLADDLERYLDDKPIHAKPPSPLERVARWSRRHRALVASAAISAAVLVVMSLGVLAASNVAIMQERNEKEIALQDRTAALAQSERDFETALDVLDQLLVRVGDKELADIPQMGMLQGEVMHDAVIFYEKMLADHPEDRRVQFETAAMKIRAADVENSHSNFATAKRSAEEAVTMLEDLLRSDPHNPAYREQLGGAYRTLSHAYIEGATPSSVTPGRVQSLAILEKAYDLFRELVEEYPENETYLSRFANVLFELWGGLYSNGNGPAKIEEVEPYVDELRMIYRSPHVTDATRAQALFATAFYEDHSNLPEDSIGHFKQAIAICDAFLERNPANKDMRDRLARAWEGIGWTHTHASMPKEDEEAAWRMAIELQKQLAIDFPTTHSKAFTSPARLLAQLLVSQKRYEEAIDILEELWELAPVDSEDYGAEALAWRAETYRLVEQYEKALADAQELIARFPSEASGWHRLGSVYRDQGKFDKAIESFSEAILRESKDGGHYAARSQAYRDLKRYMEALADIEHAIRLAPGRAGFWGIKGDLLMELGSYEEAARSFDEYLQRTRNNPYRLRQRASCYMNLNRLPDALTDIRKAISVDPEWASLWNMQGVIFDRMQDFEKAVESYSEAIRLVPKNTRLLYNRADTYQELNLHDKALADMDEAVRLAPKEAETWSFRGKILFGMGRFEEAVEDLNEAIELDPENPLLLTNRGITYRGMGSYGEAIADYNTALSIDAIYWYPTINLAWLLATAKDDEFRDGIRSLELAESAYYAGIYASYGEARFAATLAAAHAETGDFDAAVEWQQKAIELLDEDSNKAEKYARRLESYQAGRPWRDGDDE